MVSGDIFALIIVFLLWKFGFRLPPFFGKDWYLYFRPAILTALSGHSPYDVEGFFSPPWLLALLTPFALLPPPLDFIAVTIANLGAILYVLHKLKSPIWFSGLFLSIPYVWAGILIGNIDCLAAFGFVLPPWIGLIVISMKPQIGIGMAVFWIIEAWRKGGIRETLKVCSPFAVLFFLSLLIFGWWPAAMGNATGVSWNAASWPNLLPIGLYLLVKTVRERKQELAITSGIFLSPYVSAASLPIAILGLPKKAETIAAIIGLWIMYIWGFI